MGEPFLGTAKELSALSKEQQEKYFSWNIPSGFSWGNLLVSNRDRTPISFASESETKKTVGYGLKNGFVFREYPGYMSSENRMRVFDVEIDCSSVKNWDYKREKAENKEYKREIIGEKESRRKKQSGKQAKKVKKGSIDDMLDDLWDEEEKEPELDDFWFSKENRTSPEDRKKWVELEVKERNLTYKINENQMEHERITQLLADKRKKMENRKSPSGGEGVIVLKNLDDKYSMIERKHARRRDGYLEAPYVEILKEELDGSKQEWTVEYKINFVDISKEMEGSYSYAGKNVNHNFDPSHIYPKIEVTTASGIKKEPIEIKINDVTKGDKIPRLFYGAGHYWIIVKYTYRYDKNYVLKENVLSKKGRE